MPELEEVLRDLNKICVLQKLNYINPVWGTRISVENKIIEVSKKYFPQIKWGRDDTSS